MAMLSNSSFPSSLTGTTSAGSESSALEMDRLLSDLLGNIGCGEASAPTAGATPDWAAPAPPFKRPAPDWDFKSCEDALFADASPGGSPSARACAKCEERSAAVRRLDCEPFCPECSAAPAAAHCEAHGEPVRFRCAPCARVVCQECTLWKHKDHLCVPIRDAVDTCKAKIFKSIESGKTGVKCIKNSIDKTVAISKSVEREAADISAKIRKSMRHFVIAIEDRERYLLEKVEKMKQMKLAELGDQTHGLRSALAGLAKTNIALSKSIELNGVDLVIAKDKADAQIEHFAGMYKSLQPRDESFIFVPPNFELLMDFKKQGDVLSNSYNIQKHIPSTYAPLSQMPMLPEAGRTAKYLISDSLSCYPSACAAPKLLSSRIVQKCKSQCIPGSLLPVIAKPNRNVVPSMPIVSFGMDGHDEGQVSRPWGLCVDREGNIIVADRRNNRVQVFDFEGKFKLCFGRKGTEPGEFDLPAGISTDASGRIIVVDKDNHRVQIFTDTGLFILKFGSFGKDCGQFQYPWDVAVSGAGDILITDSRNHRIQLFAPDGSFITKLNFDGANHNRLLKGLTTPRGACFTPQGDIIVSDFENHRLLLIDATLTKVLGSKGHEGSAVGEFSRPSGIVCDDEGRVVVADSKNQRVMVFSPSLDFLWAVEVKGTGVDEKDRPSDVALTIQGHLAVVVETLPDARDISSPGKMFIQIF